MSTINNTDLFLVERSGVSYKVAASDLSTKLGNTDLMLVERSGTSYKVSGADRATDCQNTDLFLIERSGVSYKVAYSDVSGLFASSGGTISGSYSSNSDGYSGGYLGTKTCNSVSYSGFDARPPSQTQVNNILSSWMNCKSYSTDSNTVQATGDGVFWGRSGNSLSLTFSGFSANKEMAMWVYASASRPIVFSGLISGTYTSPAGGYIYFSLNSSGGGSVTASFGAGGDPPYVYWTGPRYSPGYY